MWLCINSTDELSFDQDIFWPKPSVCVLKACNNNQDFIHFLYLKYFQTLLSRCPVEGKKTKLVETWPPWQRNYKAKIKIIITAVTTSLHQPGKNEWPQFSCWHWSLAKLNRWKNRQGAVLCRGMDVCSGFRIHSGEKRIISASPAHIWARLATPLRSLWPHSSE